MIEHFLCGDIFYFIWKIITNMTVPLNIQYF